MRTVNEVQSYHHYFTSLSYTERLVYHKYICSSNALSLRFKLSCNPCVFLYNSFYSLPGTSIDISDSLDTQCARISKVFYVFHII